MTTTKTTTKKKAKPGPRETGRITIALRLFPDTKTALDYASARRRERMSDYAEAAIMDRLRADGYLPNEHQQSRSP